jgi:hypothetical protein
MRRYLLCLYLGLAPISQALADDPAELLSIHFVIPPNHYIDGFDIGTWAADILTVCDVPPGWTITAGSSGDPEGQLSGEGQIGVAYINTPLLPGNFSFSGSTYIVER